MVPSKEVEANPMRFTFISTMHESLRAAKPAPVIHLDQGGSAAGFMEGANDE